MDMQLWAVFRPVRRPAGRQPGAPDAHPRPESGDPFPGLWLGAQRRQTAI